jgi:hypothetical protein
MTRMIYMKYNLKDIWTQKVGTDNSGIIRREITLKNGFKAHAGIIAANGSKLFQLELDASIDIHKNYLKRFHGVEIRVIQGTQGNKDITVILSDNDLLDVFIMFLEDLIINIENLEEEKDIPFVLNTKVNYWGKLFARITGEYLSKEGQRGLFGELSVLKDLLKLTNDHLNCILSWGGPEGANQDFSNKVNALEVKTSKATNPNVNIANELQLDYSVFEHLFLAVIHVDEVNNGPDTLFKMISEIKEIIAKDSRITDFFENKLDRLGISPGEEDQYKEFGFIIRSEKFYQVQDGFPVLIKKKIDNEAIHNVAYQVDVAAMEPFKSDKAFALNKLL